MLKQKIWVKVVDYDEEGLHTFCCRISVEVLGFTLGVIGCKDNAYHQKGRMLVGKTVPSQIYLEDCTVKRTDKKPQIVYGYNSSIGDGGTLKVVGQVIQKEDFVGDIPECTVKSLFTVVLDIFKVEGEFQVGDMVEVSGVACLQHPLCES